MLTRNGKQPILSTGVVCNALHDSDILLVSLELEEIMNCADTIGVIYNGEIQKIAPAKELTTNEVGQFMMGVKS